MRAFVLLQCPTCGNLGSQGLSTLQEMPEASEMNVIEMLFNKLRVNVIIVAGLVTWLILDFGDKLIEKLPASLLGRSCCPCSSA